MKTCRIGSHPFDGPRSDICERHYRQQYRAEHPKQAGQKGQPHRSAKTAAPFIRYEAEAVRRGVLCAYENAAKRGDDAEIAIIAALNPWIKVV